MAIGKTNEIEARQRALSLMGNLTAVLGLFVLGFPLTPTAIRAMLLGWILTVAAILQFIWGHSQAAQSPATVEPRASTRLTTLALRRGVAVQSLRGSR
jgi:uncharacterized membrane protein HdeD (DUF308 family)